MLSKCANPACLAPFLYLHEGTIFNIEVESPRVDGASNAPRVRKLEHYWLCSNCARSMTVVYEHGRVVTRLARLALMPATGNSRSAKAA